MNKARIFQVLLAPHVSEKATVVAEKGNQFVFRVARDADKREIKAAVEALFEVKVKDVRTLNVKGKNKVFGRLQGKRMEVATSDSSSMIRIFFRRMKECFTILLEYYRYL